MGSIAAEDSPIDGTVLIIPSMGQLDMLIGNPLAIGWIKAVPASLMEYLYPGVALPFSLQQAHHIPAGNPFGTKNGQHNMGIILTDSGFQRQGLSGRGLDTGGTGHIGKRSIDSFHNPVSLGKRIQILQRKSGSEIQNGTVRRCQLRRMPEQKLLIGLLRGNRIGKAGDRFSPDPNRKILMGFPADTVKQSIAPLIPAGTDKIRRTDAVVKADDLLPSIRKRQASKGKPMAADALLHPDAQRIFKR